MQLPRMNIHFARILAGGGMFALTTGVLVMMYFDPTLRSDDLFKSIAQAVIIQGLLGLVVAFMFTGSNNRRRGDDGDDS